MDFSQLSALMVRAGSIRPPRRKLALLPVLSFLFLSAASPLIAQGADKGALIGRVASSETGEALGYANIIAYRIASLTDTVGTQAGGVMSKPDGTYRLPLEPGIYRLLIGYISYHPKRIQGIDVKAGDPITLDIALVPSAVRLETIDVTARALTGNDVTVLARQRKAASVSDGISAQEIKRNSDATAAEALQRVTGLTLVSGRYVYVRGLGERYSSTQLNGSGIGTPEPNKKVVPLDLFASGMLDNVVVQKTYTPDQPGEFGGGVINLTTRDFPGRRIADLSLTIGYGAQTTGENFSTYDGGSYGFLGIDDGTRALPKTVERLAGGTKITSRSAVTHEGFSADTLALLGQSFRKTWAAKSKKGPPAYGCSGTYGNEVQLFDRALGFIGSFSMSNSYRNTRSSDAFYKSDGGILEAETSYDVTTSEHHTLWGLVANGSYRVSDFNTLTLRAVQNHSAEDQVRFYEGDNQDTGKPLRNTRLQFVERQLFAGSIGTTSMFPRLARASLDLRYNYSRAQRDEPDRREYTYERESTVLNDDDEPVDTLTVWMLTKRSASLGLTRMFGTMVEEDRGPEATLTVPFKQWSGMESKAKVGFSYRNKDRDSRWRRFYFREPSFARNADRVTLLSQAPQQYMTDEWIGGDSREFVLTELTKQDTDNYRAHQDLTAEFAMLDLPIGHRLRAVVGARLEKALMQADSYDIFHQWPDSLLSHARLENTDLLPSVNLTVAPAKDMNVRLAYSTTVSRPDLRELSNFFLVDFVSGYPEKGNPELKRARIHNYDLRVEMFPSLEELAAVSFFYKQLLHPIERALIGGSNPTYTPINAVSGYLVGAEFEGRFDLRRLSKALSSLRSNANLALVKSQTELGEFGVETSHTRPLEGQSPYVANLGLRYTSTGARTEVGVLYNVFGRRLSRVGVMGLPDIYEVPRHSMDLNVARRFGGFTIKAAVENLLDSETRFEQVQKEIPGLVAAGSRVTHLEKRRQSLSLSISTTG